MSNTETRIAAVGNEKVRSELSDPAVRKGLPRLSGTPRRRSQRLRAEGLANQLNGDFSLELFKETLPTQHRWRALDELGSSLEGPRSSAVDLHLMALALRGRRLTRLSRFMTTATSCVKSFNNTNDEAKVVGGSSDREHRIATVYCEEQCGRTVDLLD